jgi:GT2 family glycosyltransferase
MMEAPPNNAMSLIEEHELLEHEKSVLIRKVAELEERLTTLKTSLVTVCNENEAIHASTSWRVTAPLRALSRVSRRLPRVLSAATSLPASSSARLVSRQIRLRPPRVRRVTSASPDTSYGAWVRAYDTLGQGDIEAMKKQVSQLTSRPLISLVMPVFNPPERYLREALDSVMHQIYEDWQLCVTDDGSTQPHVRAMLDEYASKDPRIDVAYSGRTGGISSASNAALARAEGEFVGLVDHDDVLRPHALLMVALAIDRRPDAAYIYSDEDKIDERGRRFGHYFKPDWSPTLLLCQNYLCHFSVLRTELVRQVGGFRSEFDGSQDWDLALRVTELVDKDRVVHIPHILYHWRAIPSSAAAGPDAKPYAIDAARRAVTDHLGRTGRRGYSLPVGDHQTVRFFPPATVPKVSVLIPSTGRHDLIGPCIDGLRRRTSYKALEIIVSLADNASQRTREDRVRHLDLAQEVDVVLSADGSFNFSRCINAAARAASGRLLLLLNDDIEVLHPDWLEIMVGHVLDDGVGAVGPMLLFPNETIQHAGVLVSQVGAQHLYRGRPFDTAGYVNRARIPQDLSAVTGACLLVRREAFDAVKGLDEALPISYNDIDFCLRLRSAGQRVVYVPDSVLYHHESASFGSLYEGREVAYKEEIQLMRRRWSTAFERDPMHNPNLALYGPDPSELAFPPRLDYPWRERKHAA